jgi:hypothetical protein
LSAIKDLDFFCRLSTRQVHTPGGEEGLRLARKNRPGAVTLDVIMPTINSCAVLLAEMANPGCNHNG